MTATPDDERYMTRREADALIEAAERSVTERIEAHRREHAQERAALEIALNAANRAVQDHGVAHQRDHDAHEKIHQSEQTAIVKALDSAAVERRIHAVAHEKEHEGHQREHQLDKLAITKAEQANEIRFQGVNEFRLQLSDQNKTFATQEGLAAHQRETDRRISESIKHTDDRYEENRKRIENLEKGDVKQEGKGLGSSGAIAAIVLAITVVGAVLGILVILVNFMASGRV